MKRRAFLSDSDEGVSEVIGTILMVMISVLLVSVIGLYLMQLPPTGSSLGANLVASYDPTSGTLTIEHRGGEVFNIEGFVLRVLNPEGAKIIEVPLTDGNLSGGDNYWEAGEVWTYHLDPSLGNEVTVELLDTYGNVGTNGVVLSQILYLTAGGGTTSDIEVRESGISLDTSSIDEMTTVSIRVKVFNVGSANINEQITVKITDSFGTKSKTIDTITYTPSSPLEPEQSFTVSTTWTPGSLFNPSVGTHGIVVDVVPLSDEVNLDNNRATYYVNVEQHLNVTTFDEPDLAVISYNIDMTPSYPTHGDDVTLSVYIINYGDKAATADIAFYRGNVELDEDGNVVAPAPPLIDTVEDVYISTSRIVSITWKTDMGGSVNISVAAINVTPEDPLKPETNFENNYANTTFYIKPTILLVGDDNASSSSSITNTVSYLRDAISAVGYSYDYVYVSSGNSGPAYDSGLNKLSDYDIVVWSCGYDTWSTLTSSDITNLQTYLDNGGSLWLIGAGIYDDLSDGTPAGGITFLRDYLGVGVIRHNNVALTTVNGQNTTLINLSMISASTRSVALPYGASADVFDVYSSFNGVVEGILNDSFNDYNNISIAAVGDTGYKSVFFPWEPSQLEKHGDRAYLTYRIMRWLGAELGTGIHDLAVSETDFSVTTPEYMQVVNISAVVQNNGEENETNVIVGFYVDGELISRYPDGRDSLQTGLFIEAGGTITVWKQWLATSVGEHVIVVKVDPFDYIDEISEVNNDITYSTLIDTSLEVSYNILVVDDDDASSGPYDSTVNITNALDDLGYEYDKVTVPSGSDGPLLSTPDANYGDVVLKNYNTIIWNCGGDSNDTLTLTDIQNLMDYLDGRYTEAQEFPDEITGHLFLLGGDIVNELLSAPYGSTGINFLRNYLHVNVTNPSLDSGLPSTVYGVYGDDITHGMEYPTMDEYTDKSDKVSPMSPAEGIFKAVGGDWNSDGVWVDLSPSDGRYSGVRYSDSKYSVVFLPWDLSFLGDANGTTTRSSTGTRGETVQEAPANTSDTAVPASVQQVTDDGGGATRSRVSGWQVQSGTTTIPDGDTSVTVTLSSPVDLNKAFLLMDSTGDNSMREAGKHQATGYFVSNNQIKFERSVGSGDCHISFYVIEAQGNEIEQVVSGTTTIAAGATVRDVTIPSVGDTSQCVVILNSRTSANSRNEIYKGYATGELTSTTNVRFRRAVSGTYPCYISYFVVKFSTAHSIQTGQVNFNGGASINVNLPTAVDTTRTWLYFTYDCSQNGLLQTSISGQITANNRLTFYRYQSASYNNRIRWYTIQFPAGASVQRGSQNSGSGTSTQNIAITSVDRTRSFSFVTNTCSGTGKVFPRPRWTESLSSATNLQLRRYYTGQPVVHQWQVIQLPFDNIPPTVSSTTPATGATNVDITQSVSVVFSETMDTTVTPTLTQTAGTDPGGWTFAGWSTTTNPSDTATWTHNAWTKGESITLRVSNYQDTAANSGTAYSWSFTVRPPTSVSNTNPADSDTGVSLSSDIVITFSDAMDTGNTQVTVSPDPSSWSYSWSAGDTVLTMSHGTDFDAHTTYTITILGTSLDADGVQLDGDGDGSPGGDYVFSFTTLNNPPSAPALISPTNGATGVFMPVTISWGASTDPDGDSVSYEWVVDDTNPPAAPYIASGSTGSTTATVFGLSPTTTYYWYVTAVDNVPPPNQGSTSSAIWSFTTSSTVSTDPYLANGYVTPFSGTTATNFTYYVTYYSPLNAAPSITMVYIDGSGYTMSKVDPADTDYTDGCTYYYSTKLSMGSSHAYYFYFESGTDTMRLPVLSGATFNGPVVDQATTVDSSGADYESEVTFMVLRFFGYGDERVELRASKVDMQFSEENPMLGGSYVIKTRVYNYGGTNTTAIVRLLDGDVIMDTQSVFVPAGSYAPVESIWTPLFAGNRPITMAVDPDDDITEVFEFNNNATRLDTTVYFFYDDMENGDGNWEHDSTAVLINGEGRLDFMNEPVDSNILGDWGNSSGFHLNTEVDNPILQEEYHSQPSCYFMHEVRANRSVRAPIDIVLVIDTSGSMGDDPDGDGNTKLDDAKNAAKYIVDQMTSQDRMALYTFDGGENYQLVQDYLFMDTSNKTNMKSTIDGLAANSWTPIWDSIGEAINYAISNDRSVYTTVIALTDGDDWGTDGWEYGSETYCPGSEPGTDYTQSTWGLASGLKWGDTPHDFWGQLPSGRDVVRYDGSYHDIYIGSTHAETTRTGLIHAPLPVYTIGLGVQPQGSNSSAPGYMDPTDPAYKFTSEYDLKQIGTTSNGGDYYYAPTSSQLQSIFADIFQNVQSDAQSSTRSSINWENPWDDGSTANSAKYLETDPIDLRYADHAELSFYHKYFLEVGANGGVLLVATSDSPSGPWKYKYIQADQPYTGNILISQWSNYTDDYGTPMAWCWNGISAMGTFDWEYVSANLDEFVGQYVKIRLQYIYTTGGTGFGWAIDDFKVTISTDSDNPDKDLSIDNWVLNETSQPGVGSHSGTHAWFCGVSSSGGDLRDGIDSSLYTRPIDLTNARTASLQAYFRFNWEYAAGRPPDGFRIEVSDDNGVSWSSLSFGVRSAWNLSGNESDANDGVLDGKSFTGIDDGNNWVAANTLTRVTTNLDGFTGKVIILRFRVITNTDGRHYQDGSAFKGFYVDDVVVSGYSLGSSSRGIENADNIIADAENERTAEGEYGPEGLHRSNDRSNEPATERDSGTEPAMTTLKKTKDIESSSTVVNRPAYDCWPCYYILLALPAAAAIARLLRKGVRP